MANEKELLKSEVETASTIEELEARINNLTKLIEQSNKERDQYRAAYEQVVRENSNVWGMYSNLIDYVANNTIRKQDK